MPRWRPGGWNDLHVDIRNHQTALALLRDYLSQRMRIEKLTWRSMRPTSRYLRRGWRASSREDDSVGTRIGAGSSE